MLPVLYYDSLGFTQFILTIHRNHCQGKRIAWDFDAYMEQVAGTLPVVLFLLVVNALSVLRFSHLAGEAKNTNNRET